MRNLVQLHGLKVLILSGDDHSMEALALKMNQFFQNIETKTINSLNPELVVSEAGDAHILMADLYDKKKATEELLLHCKTIYPDLKLMVFCNSIDLPVIQNLFREGIHIFLTKDIQKYELDVAIEKAIAGESYVSMEISNRVTSHFILKKNK